MNHDEVQFLILPAQPLCVHAAHRLGVEDMAHAQPRHQGAAGNPGNRLHLVSGIAVIDVGRNMEPFGHIQCDNRSGGGGMLSDGPVSQHIDHLIVDHIGPRVNGRQGAAPGHNRGQAGQIIVNLGQKFLHRLLAEGGLVGGSGVPRHLRGRVGQALFIPLYAVLKNRNLGRGGTWIDDEQLDLLFHM